MNRVRFGLCGVAALIVAPTALAQDCITTVWSEDAEGYVNGQNIITGQACFPACPVGFSWSSWENDPGSGLSEASSAFGNPGLSVQVSGTRAGGVDDLVHTYQGLNISSGTWLYAADLYVPSGTTGESYFILLNQYAADGQTTSENWSTQIHIDGDNANLESDFDGGTVALQFNVWRRIETIISLDDDLQTIKYDGEVINLPGKTWTGGVSGGGIASIGAVDLYGNNASPVYYDNISLCSIPPEGACCFRSDPCIDGVLRSACEAMAGDAIFQGIGSACGACQFYGDDGWEIEDLLTQAPPFQWTGDTCNDFPGIPFNPDCEFFPSDCSECDLSDSQDQAWSFAIPWSATWTFSTCGAADFDTQLYAGSTGCSGNLGFDDDCTRIANEDDSELPLALPSGPVGTVKITLEGFDADDCGNYTLSVGAPCPPIAIGPDQEILGPCADEDSDIENVGCNAAAPQVPTFTPIICGQTFAGTVGNFVAAGAGRRDLDWFALTIPATIQVTLDAVGNYPQVVLFLADLNATPGVGEDECTNAGNILASDTTPTCTEADGSRAAAQVSLEVGPGLYSPIVSTTFVDPALPVALGGVPCGSPYELTVTCGLTCDPTSGDVTGEGCVSFADILIILGAWGSSGDPGIPGDANCDGTVSFADILLVLGTWGQGCP